MEKEVAARVFAEVEHVDQLRAAIRGCTYFDERRVDDYVVFNYKMGHADTFPNPALAPDPTTREHWLLRRECRGIVFHAETGALLARRFHKFFNVNELDETLPEEIDLQATGYVVLEKLDGNFVSPFYTQGELKFGTKTSHRNGEARQVNAFVASHDGYLAFSRDWVDRGFSPIFEWCSPCDKRVVKYHEPTLTLTAIRNNKTGEYVLYEEMQQSAAQAGIPVVKAWRGSAESVSDLLAKIGQEEGLEGCVLRFDDGRMYKIKTSWYSTQTVNSDLICQERIIWQLILNNNMDDVKGSIKAQPAEGEESSGGRRTIELLRKKIDRFSAQLYGNVEAKARELLDRVIQARRDTAASGGGSSEAAQDARQLAARLEQEAAAYEKALVRRLVKRFASLESIERLAAGPGDGGETAYREALDLFLEETIGFMVEGTEKKHTFDTVVRPLGGSLYFY